MNIQKKIKKNSCRLYSGKGVARDQGIIDTRLILVSREEF